MATTALMPHTRIDNTIIDDLAAKIGIYGLGIYVAIKRHLNWLQPVVLSRPRPKRYSKQCNEKGPPLPKRPSVEPRVLLLFQRCDFFTAPELVRQHDAQRVNVHVVVEVEASAGDAGPFAVWIAAEVEPPVLVIEPREAIFTAQRQARAQPW